MSEIKWIKLSVNMFDDEKIKLIRTMPEGDSIVVIWVQILCLAGKINDHGAVYMGQNLAYSDEMLSTILGHPLNTMRIALQTLEQFEMIEVSEDGKIDVINWEKHQSTDKMARMKEQSRIRQQKYYYRSKLRELGVDVDSKEFPNDLDKMKSIYEKLDREPNVRLVLANETEVRSKKLEERSKKEEERSKQQEVRTKDEKKEKNGSDELPLSKNVFKAWEKLWMFPNFVQQEMLVELSNKYGDELVVAAIKIAGSKDVIKGRAINFIEAVLKEWEDNNVMTIEQAREYQRNRNKQNQRQSYKQTKKDETLPEWATDSEKPVKDELVSEDESKDLEDRLERLRKMREEQFQE